VAFNTPDETTATAANIGAAKGRMPVGKQLVGGFLAHWVTKKSERLGSARGATVRERGVVIASGLMAGGALGGVFGAALRLFPWYREDLIKTPFFDRDAVSQSVSALLFAGLCGYLWWNSTRKVRHDSSVRSA